MTRRKEVTVEPNPRRTSTVTVGDPEPAQSATNQAPPVDFPRPRVRTAAPIADLLSDVRALVKQGLDAMKAQGGPKTPNDAKTLEALARSAKVAQDMERTVNEELDAKLNKASDSQLVEIAKGLGIPVEDDDGEA